MVLQGLLVFNYVLRLVILQCIHHFLHHYLLIIVDLLVDVRSKHVLLLLFPTILEIVDKLNYSLSLLFRNPPVLVQSVEAEHILLHYGGIGLVLRLDQQLDLLLVRIVQGNQILRILRSPLHQLSLLIIISFLNTSIITFSSKSF